MCDTKDANRFDAVFDNYAPRVTKKRSLNRFFGIIVYEGRITTFSSPVATSTPFRESSIHTDPAVRLLFFLRSDPWRYFNLTVSRLTPTMNVPRRNRRILRKFLI